MISGKSGGSEGAEAAETLLSHLVELRDRILRMFLAVLVIFLALFPFANTIYTFMAKPLMAHLPEGTSMIAIEVAAPFLIPFKLVLLLALVLAIPYILYQVWAFVAPGLYQNEKRLAMPLVVSSTLLFYLGMAFAYFVVFPLIFAFFTATAPEGVAVMTDISRYLDFIIMLFIAFGIAFEVPIATILLVSMGATTTDQLASKRPYVIVGTFVVGMVLTPPDIISQTLLALPMWVLFEIGLILSRMMEKRKAEAERRAEVELAQAAEHARAGAPSGPASGPKTPGAGSRPGSDAGSKRAGRAADTGRASSVGAGLSPSPNVGMGGVSNEDSSTDVGTRNEDYRPLTAEEMDAELDRLEEEERRQQELRARRNTGDVPPNSPADTSEDGNSPERPA